MIVWLWCPHGCVDPLTSTLILLLIFVRLCQHTHHEQEVYAAQIDIIRPVVLKQDPTGLFRTRLLSDVFRLPY